MHLRYIEEVSFRSSEATNFRTWSKKNKAEAASLDEEAVLCFVSMSGDQLVFVYGFTTFGEREVLATSRLRLNRGRWEPLMLRDYAKEVGLQLDGLKTYEEHYKANGKRRGA